MMDDDDPEAGKGDSTLDVDDVEELEEIHELTPPPSLPPTSIPSRPTFRGPAAMPIAPPPVPTRPGVVVVPPRTPAAKGRGFTPPTGVAAKPPLVPRATAPMSIQIPVIAPPREPGPEAPDAAIEARGDNHASERPASEPRANHEPPPPVRSGEPTAPPPIRTTEPSLPPASAQQVPELRPSDSGRVMSAHADVAHLSSGGIEVSQAIPTIASDQPLEAALESPTVLDRALDELGDAGGEKRAETMAKQPGAATGSRSAAPPRRPSTAARRPRSSRPRRSRPAARRPSGSPASACAPPRSTGHRRTSSPRSRRSPSSCSRRSGRPAPRAPRKATSAPSART